MSQRDEPRSSQIDFLPAVYRNRDVRRKNHWWRSLVVVMFLVMLAGGAYAVHAKHGRIESKLASVRQAHESDLRRRTQLAKLAWQVRRLSEQAELIVYLRHPWPRTRIVAAALAALPDSIHMEQLRVHRGEPVERPRSVAPFVRPAIEVPRQANQPAPAQQDLKQLRGETDGQPTHVVISGTMGNQTVFRHYLAELARNDLFTQVELLEIEPDGSASERFQFSVRLTVLPGYGQPQGPDRTGAKNRGGAP